MKRVNLIKLTTEITYIGDYDDSIQFHNMNFNKPNMQVINTSEYLPQYIEKEIQPVHKIVDHGVEHYISVDNKIWEYLYLIENPVTAKSQEDKIGLLKANLGNARAAVESSAIRYKKIVYAPLWVRIKWVFTGMNLI